MNGMNLSPELAPYVALVAIMLVVGITLNILSSRRSRVKKGYPLRSYQEMTKTPEYRKALMQKRISTEEWHQVTRKDLDRFHFPDGE